MWCSSGVEELNFWVRRMSTTFLMEKRTVRGADPRGSYKSIVWDMMRNLV
jgi:hypothetical protein